MRPPAVGGRTRSLVPLALLLFVSTCLVHEVLGQRCSAAGSQTEVPAVNGLCPCNEGWGGVNCNICKTDQACSAAAKESEDVTCRNSFEVVQELNGLCRAPSEDITALLHGTGWVNFVYQTNGSFYFEVWKQAVNFRNETYYLDLFRCDSSHTTQTIDTKANLVRFTSPDLKCAVVCERGKDRTCTEFLASIIDQVGNGEKKGSIVTCDPVKSTCEVHEELLDNFLGGVIADQCVIGECAARGKDARTAANGDFTEKQTVDVFERASIIMGSTYLFVVLVLTGIAMAACMQSRDYQTFALGKSLYGSKNLGKDEFVGKGYSLVWQDMIYEVKGRRILRGVTGMSLPGELTAIMGPSGSGKTSLLDILALKPKSGAVSGRVSYNGVSGNTDRVKDEIGFVDQEDNMLGTMTVYEAVLFSAVLRLPEPMPLETKIARVLRVLKELRIQHIADSYIGSMGHRGISGGEKRRVMVGMELVKIPKILFLDEPTSGLDSFNASLLVDCLRELAATHRTNIVMTIHQPRSNIFRGFDRLLVLNKGEATYVGKTNKIENYLASIGKPLPHDYNTADFLIDILFTKENNESIRTMLSGPLPSEPSHNSSHEAETPRSDSSEGTTDSNGRRRNKQHSKDDSADPVTVEIELPPRQELASETQHSPLHDDDVEKAATPADQQQEPPQQREEQNDWALELNGVCSPITGKIASELEMDDNYYARMFAQSADATVLLKDIEGALRRNDGDREEEILWMREHGYSEDQGLVAKITHPFRRWAWEVGILSRRSMLDIRRNPVLVGSHVLAAVYFAIILGIIYYNLSMESLQAVQNRLGAFLLSCVFLAFTSVSALPLFWLERNLYLHEHSNRFYSSSAYFTCKIFFDLLPLRILPTLCFGAVTYTMIELRPGFQHFMVYEVVLCLLVATSSVINLIIGMLTKHIMSGILVATIVMIHFLMLTSLFINFKSMNIHGLQFLQRVSFLNYAYQALAENELVGRHLEKFPIPSGTGVLHELGFSTDSLNFDMLSLFIYLTVAIALAFIVLKVAVRECR